MKEDTEDLLYWGTSTRRQLENGKYEGTYTIHTKNGVIWKNIFIRDTEQEVFEIILRLSRIRLEEL